MIDSAVIEHVQKRSGHRNGAILMLSELIPRLITSAATELKVQRSMVDARGADQRLRRCVSQRLATTLTRSESNRASACCRLGRAGRGPTNEDVLERLRRQDSRCVNATTVPKDFAVTFESYRWDCTAGSHWTDSFPPLATNVPRPPVFSTGRFFG